MDEIDYTTHAGEISGEAIEAVFRLVQICFEPEPSLDFAALVRTKHRPQAVLGWCGSTPVGFKIGYERGPDELYSWLGGVDPGFRRRGIARALLERQHAWCREQGYARITTEAMSQNRAMLMLNLAAGFVVVGTRNDARGLKVLLERSLEP